MGESVVGQVRRRRRLPRSQLASRVDHIHGATDDFSHYAVEGIVHHYDWLTTVLHQFGLNHRDLRFRIGPREIRLVENDEARVVREILA